MRTVALSAAGLTLLWLSSVPAQERELSFEDRVKAQEAIERVYYAHQVDTRVPFEEAVPRAVLEKKVRTYLKKSLALDNYWSTPVGADALRHELERIATETRFPDRLREIYAALGNDSFLIEECFARSSLVDRLVKNFSVPLDAELVGEGSVSETWWNHVAPTIDETRVRAVASTSRVPPDPAAKSSQGGCGTGNSWDAGILEDAIPAMRSAPSVWTGSLMLILGEFDRLRYDPLTDSWTRMSTVGAPPSFSSPVWTGSELIIPNTSSRAGGRYDPVTDSWQPITAANAPPSWSARVWTGSEIIVWGGSNTSGYFNTGARYNPSSNQWTSISTVNAPSGRSSIPAVWTGTEMIVWGGEATVDPPNYVFVNTGGRYNPSTDTWTPTSTVNAPSPRSSHSAVWTGSRMIVWGGHRQFTFSTDLYNTGALYDPATNSWTATSMVDVPTARNRHTTVWTGSEMIVWGQGQAASPGGRYDPVANQWSTISTVSAPSPSRVFHSTVWTGNQMIVWGGDESNQRVNTGGRYDPSSDSWTPMETGLSPRMRHTAVWTGNLMLIWGGWPTAANVTDTGARYDPLLDTWMPMTLAGAPGPRREHTAVWTGTRMVVWGGVFVNGIDPIAYLATGGSYDPVADSWTSLTDFGAPLGRTNHTAVWTGSEMVVWGGTSGSSFTPLNTGGRYDPAVDEWSATSTVGAPSARANHAATWTGNRMIAWGGNANGGNFPVAGGRYDPVNDSWSPTSIVGAPAGRSGPTMVWTGQLAIVWGGDTGSSTNTGGRYNPVADTWSATNVGGAPTGRVNHTTVWTGTRMMVWGGNSTNTGSLYDPVSDIWSPTPTAGAPSGREDHIAVWTGAHVIVWGGNGSLLSNSGSRLIVDNDDDGFPDLCDVCPFASDPGQQDFDFDGRGDACDNCPSASNSNQSNLDSDGRGDACDCAPSDASAFATPGEISGIAFDEDRSTMRWSSEAPAAGTGTVYSVLRGVTNDLPVVTAVSAVCVTPAVANNEAVDSSTPDVDEAFWYLVKGQNACGSGTYGFSSDGIERQSSVCP